MKAEWKVPDLRKIRLEVIDKLTTAAEVVTSAAIQECKVDSGNLRGSITAEIDEENLTARIGTPVEYAPYVEFGTGEFAEGGNGRQGGWVYDYQGNKGPKGPRFTLGNKPLPFLRPALNNSKDQVRKIMLRGKDAS